MRQQAIFGNRIGESMRAAGAAAGVAAGAVAGPIGAAIGAVTGAVAGGLLGKAGGEYIDPTTDDTYLRDNFATRPYVKKGETFETHPVLPIRRPGRGHLCWQALRGSRAGADDRLAAQGSGLELRRRQGWLRRYSDPPQTCRQGLIADQN